MPRLIPARCRGCRAQHLMRAALGCFPVALLCFAAPSRGAAPAPKESARGPTPWPGWTVFHGNAARTGVAPLDFSAPPFSRAWTFSLGRHTWSYCQGASVWSACAISGTVDGKPRIFVGAYDHNLYALDPDTGRETWRFTTGCLVAAAPAFAVVDGQPMVFAASSDRSVYGLDARTGRKLWQFETYSWTYTIGESVTGSPLLVPLGKRLTLFFTMWNSDRRPLRTVQTGELFAVDAATGQLRWRRKLASTPLSSPAFLDVDGRPTVFTGSESGAFIACDARTGRTVFRIVTGHKVLAAPVCTRIAQQPIVFITNAFGMVRCLSARSGRFIWKYKTGHEVLSTPALVKAGGKLLLVVGSSDRFVHAIEAKTGRRVWRFMTRKYVVASPAVANVRGRPMVFINSLDNALYGLDAETGCEILRFESGDMLWPYETRGSSIWSSASVATRANGKPLLLYPAYDGRLYAFAAGALLDGGPRQGDAILTGAALGTNAPSRPAPPSRGTTWRAATLFVMPAAGLTFFLAGALTVVLGRPRKALLQRPPQPAADR